MEINRRDILKLGMAQTALALMPKVEAEAFNIVHRDSPSILQGATDETRTQFSIVHNVDLKFNVTAVNSKGDTWQPSQLKTQQHEGQPKCVTKVFFDSLYLGEEFTLRLADNTNKEIESRTFKMLDLKKENFRFALCSCMDHERHEPQIWQDLVKQNPDMIFFIGDSVYANRGAKNGCASPEHLWKKFCEARSVLEIYFSKKLVPIIAVWDDHDFGRNDSDCSSYPYVKESQDNFNTFFAQEESHCRTLLKGPGVASTLKVGSQQFILLDDRSFRAARGSQDRYAHWGQEQEEWMYELIGSHEGLTWLINGSQFTNRLPWKESISRDHFFQFKKFTEALQNLSKVVFISGDVHYSEIARLKKPFLGYQTYEITSSSMHSFCVPGFPMLAYNPNRIASTGKRNYVIVETNPGDSTTMLKVTSHSKNGKINFEKLLEV